MEKVKKKGAKKTGVEALEPEDIIILVPLRGVQKKRIQYQPGSSVKINIDDSKQLREKNQ